MRITVEKISMLIDALRHYAIKNARQHWAEHPKDIYHAPCLASWDAFMWLELVPDWELIDFLISGTDEAKLLMKSLQSFLQWNGQNEIEYIYSNLKMMSIIN